MSKIVKALRLAPSDVPEPVLELLAQNDEPGSPVESPPPLQTETVQAVSAAAPRISPEVRVVSIRIPDQAPLLSHGDDPAALEQYRIIRTKIVYSRPSHSVLVVTSPSVGDGKTVTALNQAYVMAMRASEQVLIVDADLHRSKVHTYLGVPRKPGLAEVLAGTAPLEEAVVRVRERPNLFVLTSGEAVISPAELLESPAWPLLIGRLRQEFQRMILDCPPVDVVASYAAVAAASDDILMVVRPDHTDRRLCLDALGKVGKKLLGVVINDEPALFRRRSSYDYYTVRADGENSGRRRSG
jgi:capsular exopolysaccharide synthesis family protein